MIVLSIIALATILVVAFFSRSTSELVISKASASSESSSMLADTALEVIVNDLRQEIVDGSQNPEDSNRPVYVAKAPANAVPVRTHSATNLPNLLKCSGSGIAFDGSINGTKRASPISSGSATLEGRTFSPERWNAPRLLSGTSATPPTSFKLPDWIYLTRSGSNPTITGTANKPGGTDPILGRFAYVIYDEGGLLDINCAGYPSGLAASELAKKGHLALADLTKVGLSSAEVQKLVSWRNASTASNPTQFVRNLRMDPNSSMQVAEGDRAFVSRQQLLNFFSKNNLNAGALPFLGTFSRGFNQPSFGASGPALPGTAAVLPTESPSGSYTVPAYAGNNDADSSTQKLINPRLLDVRVSTSFDRFLPYRTGTTKAKVGEPLIAKRFPLHRLAWLTYKGPIAPGGVLTSEAQLLLGPRQAGLPDDFLKLGNEENIRKAFGLEWATDPAGSGRKVWVYVQSPSARIIGRLEDVRALNRDPNFLELLKAAIHVGSLGKGAASDDICGMWMHAHDIRTDFQLLGIFANIVDQYDSDGFPTEIALPTFSDADLLGLLERKVRGIENLPYITGMRAGAIVLSQSNPAPPAGKVPKTPPVDPTPVVDPGSGALLFNNWLWNPHSTLSGSTTTKPTEFRIVTFPGDPIHPGSAALSNLQVLHEPWGSGTTSSTPTKLAAGTAFALGQSDTELLFELPASGNLFTQPTALIFPGVPAGTNLRTGANNKIRSISLGSNGYLANVVDSNRRYVGALAATFPIHTGTTVSGTTYLLTAAQVTGEFLHGSKSGQNKVVSSLLQYKAGANWVTYDFKTTRLAFCTAWIDPGSPPFDPSQPGNSSASGGSRCTVWSDPRTSRFGSAWALLSPKDDITSLSLADASLTTLRAGTSIGTFLAFYGPGHAVSGTLSSLGWIATSPATSIMPGQFYPQSLAENVGSLANAYKDPDGEIRGGMAFHSPSNNLIGKPLATNNDTSRPIVLNRPFRTVAELGYTFRDQPWKQIDFFTPESGDAALLDLFCLNEDTSNNGITAGKLNLNTRNPQVLQAVLAGSGRNSEGATAILTDSEANSLANAICTWQQRPFTSLGDLVGGYRSGAYQSFFKDNPAPFNGSDPANNILQRYREAPIRALSDVGEVRVWNLFIDIVAQAGSCPGTPTLDLGKFALRGETRWWVHLALDRATGRILEIQTESVTQ